MESEAFEREVLRHKDRIHAYATLMLRDPEEARDVAQEALVRLWKHFRKIDADGVRPWLMRATHNVCIDRIRRRKVRSEVDDSAIPFQPDDAPGPRQLAQSSELGRLIARELEALGPQDRAVVVLREIQGMAYDEIAKVLGLPLGTLKARLHRAREKLRGRLTRVGVMP